MSQADRFLDRTGVMGFLGYIGSTLSIAISTCSMTTCFYLLLFLPFEAVTVGSDHAVTICLMLAFNKFSVGNVFAQEDRSGRFRQTGQPEMYLS